MLIFSFNDYDRLQNEIKTYPITTEIAFMKSELLPKLRRLYNNPTINVTKYLLLLVTDDCVYDLPPSEALYSVLHLNSEGNKVFVVWMESPQREIRPLNRVLSVASQGTGITLLKSNEMKLNQPSSVLHLFEEEGRGKQ